MFRSYNAFTSRLYKLAILLCYPLFAVLGCILVQNGCFGLIKPYHYMVSQTILMSAIIGVECIIDYWLFSGIQCKSANHMDFLKGSIKGKQFFKNALITNIIRRLVLMIGCSAANLALGVWVFDYGFSGTESVEYIVIYTLCTYFFSSLCTFLSRFGDTWWVNVGIGYAGSMIATIVVIFVPNCLTLWAWIAIYAVLSIIVTVIEVKFAIKKVEDSYYDQRS